MHHIHYILDAKPKDTSLKRFAQNVEFVYHENFNFDENNWTHISFVEKVQTSEVYVGEYDQYCSEKQYYSKYKDQPIAEVPFDVHEDALYKLILAQVRLQSESSYDDFAERAIKSIEGNRSKGFSIENYSVFSQIWREFNEVYDSVKAQRYGGLPTFNAWEVYEVGLSNTMTVETINNLDDDTDIVLVGLDIHT